MLGLEHRSLERCSVYAQAVEHIERSGRLTRDDVARAALQLLDEHGLPDLTMRRLAATLDVQAGALYWHFPNKQTLLAEISDMIVARANLERRSGQATRDAALALRDALLAYRDGAEVVSSSLALGLGAGASITMLVDAMTTDGFSAEVAARAAEPLLHFIVGHVFYQQQRMCYDSLGVTSDQVGASVERVSTPEDDFGFGLDVYLTGLDLLKSSSRPAESPA